MHFLLPCFFLIILFFWYTTSSAYLAKIKGEKQDFTACCFPGGCCAFSRAHRWKQHIINMSKNLVSHGT